MQTLTDIFARRIPGPFRPYGPGQPYYYESALSKAGHIASHYLYFRRSRGLGATEARKAALALPPAHVPGKGWYGGHGAAGSVWEAHGDKLRWIESTSAAGLRFIGWADELPGGPSHTGWYADSRESETLRGGVWQLPARKGKARLVYGYAEFEGRGETNPGSAAIVVSDTVESEPCRLWESVTDLPEIRDAARWADGIAESVAEDQRDYNEAYETGKEAAGHDSAAAESRRAALRLVAAMRADYRREARHGPIWQVLESTLRDLLGRSLQDRETRDSLWADCPSSMESAWAAGFCDESGFARAVRLGYLSRDDWQGKPEENPCDKESS